MLCRTAPADPKARHAGLSQFIVDLKASGVTIRPILMLDGSHHFNEVTFDGVETAGNYDTVYQHDPLGGVGTIGYGAGTPIWGAARPMPPATPTT